MNKWRYILTKDFNYYTPYLSNIEFKNDFIEIKDSKILIKKDYAWDGCSPSLRINLGSLLPQGLWLGVWDGPLNKDARPSTYYATLVHDALCQFRKDINGLNKNATVDMFKDLLTIRNSPFWMSYLYPLAIKYFGPQNWK